MQTQSHLATLRQSVIAVLGAPPDPADLVPEILDVQVMPGYRREHIRFQVSPNDFSFAYLFLPDQVLHPLPTVYFHHPFSDDFTAGKEAAHTIGPELVARGYAVLAPDALGFGERRQSVSNAADADLAYVFHQLSLRLLRGETLLRKIIWDAARGIDYLLTRPEVDGQNLAFVGHDYGGLMAVWAMAMDERIRVGVAHGVMASFRQHIREGVPFQAEFVVPRLMQVADLHHIVSLVAPRPFLLSVGGEKSQAADAFDTYKKALPTYERFSFSNRLSFYQHKVHNPPFDAYARFKLYQWLDSWLMPY
jgi:pimeloyl-ACP methyl ester carboxylesterase